MVSRLSAVVDADDAARGYFSEWEQVSGRLDSLDTFYMYAPEW